MSAHPLVRLLDKPVKRVVGLMSGTSIDGIDAALCDIEGHGDDARVTLVDFRTTPYSAAQKELIFTLLKGDAAALCQGNFALGEWLADAARAFGETPDLIGSHGQTVWHQAPSMGGIASTLQLGEAAVIAARTGAVTVADFRVADMAAG
ncbi:MAG: anmK, partial [Myxococcales bacterium]|nr:anmK [Myxococcales bacterium]